MNILLIKPRRRSILITCVSALAIIFLLLYFITRNGSPRIKVELKPYCKFSEISSVDGINEEWVECAVIKVTNETNHTVTLWGRPEAIAYRIEYIENGTLLSSTHMGNQPAVMSWETHPLRMFKTKLQNIANLDFRDNQPLWASDWTTLRANESTILFPPVPNDAQSIRVGILVSSEAITPTDGKWIFSPMMQIKNSANGRYLAPQ